MTIPTAHAIIRRFHERYPGASARLFMGQTDDRGATSYDRVMDAISGTPAAVLDLGCGDAALLEHLAKRYPSAALYGVDFSESELRLGAARLPQSTLVVGNFNDPLPFPADSFDLVISHMALMLAGNLDAIFTSVARVLKQCGAFIFVVDALSLAPSNYPDVLRTAMGAAGLPLRARFDMTADPRLQNLDDLRDALEHRGLTLLTSERFSVKSSSDPDACVDTVLGSYPFADASEQQRHAAAAAVRAWCAQGEAAIEIPLQLFVAERSA